eukprot:1194776-Prorocentrum_minimum.AAC.3
MCWLTTGGPVVRSLQTRLHKAGSAYIAEPGRSYATRMGRGGDGQESKRLVRSLPSSAPAGDGGMPGGINFIYSHARPSPLAAPLGP